MEDPKPSAISLPPGCRFRPSEEDLLRHYLGGKNSAGAGAGAGGFSGFIGEVDVYGGDPFELPETACYAYGRGGRKRHWYCYAGSKGLKGPRRRAKTGFWRRRGRSKSVVGSEESVVLGIRNVFEFYLGRSGKSAVKTDWVLYEYSLFHHLKASFVLCRVFSKPRLLNPISEYAPVSCAEDSVSTVRHVGIQHDGDVNQIEEQNVSDSAPLLSFEFPMYIDPDPELNLHDFTAQHLLAILEDDYLELNDLVD